VAFSDAEGDVPMWDGRIDDIGGRLPGDLLLQRTPSDRLSIVATVLRKTMRALLLRPREVAFPCASRLRTGSCEPSAGGTPQRFLLRQGALAESGSQIRRSDMQIIMIGHSSGRSA
jgi:hypothetical protein